ncbi:hypothetical protein [Streptomyces sp. NPDC088727]|uniref:hypothetical protein n=1 Tax=Streptomyces sp. NPDC088727 TaxID=3365875 RepID=UPI0037FA719A
MTTGGGADSEALYGGMANAGAVFRRGALVERPAPPHAAALHAHLRALREHGFDAAPTPVGLTGDGRERLTFIPGEVALPPFPDWVLTTTALESVGRLLRRLHAASEAFGAGADVDWPQDLAALPGVIEQATETCRGFVARRVADGDPVYLQALADRGGWERWDRMQAWLAAHRETFTAALMN